MITKIYFLFSTAFGNVPVIFDTVLATPLLSPYLLLYCETKYIDTDLAVL